LNLNKLKENIKKCEVEYLVVTAILFLTVLVGILFLIFAPKQDFSEDENRVLESTPKITVQGIEDGSFMKSIENYVGDHFMFRKNFVTLNTSVQLLCGKRDLGSNYSHTPAEGGVYFGDKNHIYEVLLPNKTDVFSRNVEAITRFAEEIKIPFYFMPVPSGAQEQQENLPFSAPSHNQREEFDAIKSKEKGNIKVIDLFDTLNIKTGNDYYYKTDHHWNTYGAYEGYKALVEQMNISPAPKEDFEFKPIKEPFYGTLYSKAVYDKQEPDTVYLPYYKKQAVVTQQTGKKKWEGLFWKEYFTKKDKYSSFLGGNHSVDVVKNEDVKNNKKLLIIKDSYANSMIPFLATDFSEIHIIDLRYYNQNIYEYVKDNKITDAAAVYSIKQLCDVSVANKLRIR
jgi:hypothetical protein